MVVRPRGARRPTSSSGTAVSTGFVLLPGVLLGACAAFFLMQRRSFPDRTALRSDPGVPGRPAWHNRTHATQARSRVEALVRSFASLEEASGARQALLLAGIDPLRIELRVLEDEAGPTEGNFLIGNGRTTHGGPPGPVLTGPEVPYERNFDRTVTHGAHLVLVRCLSETERQQADQVLASQGGADPVTQGRIAAAGA